MFSRNQKPNPDERLEGNAILDYDDVLSVLANTMRVLNGELCDAKTQRDEKPHLVEQTIRCAETYANLQRIRQENDYNSPLDEI